MVLQGDENLDCIYPATCKRIMSKGRRAHDRPLVAPEWLLSYPAT